MLLFGHYSGIQDLFSLDSMNLSKKKTHKMTDKKLFTPGPLLCSPTVKQAMQRDLGSRDIEFINAVKAIRNGLLKVAGVSNDHEWIAIPMQGSGTFSVEAVFQTAVPKDGRVSIWIQALLLSAFILPATKSENRHVFIIL